VQTKNAFISPIMAHRYFFGLAIIYTFYFHQSDAVWADISPVLDTIDWVTKRTPGL